MRSFLSFIMIGAALSAPVLAKLPATDEAGKAKAAEAAAKTAWNEKVGLYKHCQALDRVASNYRKTAKNAQPPVETAPCTDPGEYVAPVAVAASAPAKPLEASGAHSPTTTAVSPPSTRVPAAGSTASPAATVAAAPTGQKPAASPGTTAAAAVAPAGTKAPAGAGATAAASAATGPKGTAVTPAKDKPIEMSEAHSPPGTAISPPSNKETAKEMGTGKK